jgi:N-methylhydantoinase B
VVRRDGAIERFAVATTLRVDDGDLIRIRTGNGGGYGPPAERSLDLLLDDLRNGYVTGEIASGVYGLAVD